MTASHRNLTHAELKHGLAAASVLLVDVREPHEFALGHIPGSVNVPLSRFDPAGISPAPGQEVVFSCAAGVRSLKAIELARAAGYDYGAHYPRGMKGWLMSGEPFDTG